MKLLIIVAVLTLSTLIDLKTRKIPNIITFPFLIMGLLYTYKVTGSIFPNIIFIVLYFIIGMTNVIGLGDIKLIMGLFAWDSPIPVNISILIAALAIIFYGQTSGKLNIKNGLSALKMLYYTGGVDKKCGESVPFAPFLLLGYFIAKGGCLLWL